jgi:hypothetical protein
MRKYIQLATFESASSDKTHRVHKNTETNRVSCTCRGWVFHRACWHSRTVAKQYSLKVQK